jgi:hypothetical protein
MEVNSKKIVAPATPTNCRAPTEFLFATYNTENHLNIYVNGKSHTIDPDTARKLRDLFNEMYPVPAPAAKPEPTTVRKRPRGSQEYKGNGKHAWETVHEGESGASQFRTFRLRVPGGWLYRYDEQGTITFVPAPEVIGYAI